MRGLKIVGRAPGKGYPTNLSFAKLSAEVRKFQAPVWRSEQLNLHACGFKALQTTFNFDKTALELGDIH